MAVPLIHFIQGLLPTGGKGTPHGSWPFTLTQRAMGQLLSQPHHPANQPTWPACKSNRSVLLTGPCNNSLRALTNYIYLGDKGLTRKWVAPLQTPWDPSMHQGRLATGPCNQRQTVEGRVGGKEDGGGGTVLYGLIPPWGERYKVLRCWMQLDKQSCWAIAIENRGLLGLYPPIIFSTAIKFPWL